MRISWGWVTIFVVAIVLLIAGLSHVSDRPQPQSGEFNPIVASTTPWHHLDRFFAADLGGELDRVIATERGIALAPDGRGFPRTGRWIGAWRKAASPFTELLPSMNLDCPPECGAVIEVRVRDAHYGDESPWLYLGKWGRTIQSRRWVTTFDRGEVATDILKLNQPADAYQVRVTLQSFALPAGPVPTLRSVSVCTTGDGPNVANPPKRTSLMAAVLAVPFIPQGDGDAAVRGEVCSPTSTTMVLHSLGTNVELMSACEAIYDDVFDIFGNWGRAVAYAGTFGHDAYLTRLHSLDEAYEFLGWGQPLVLSIRFAAGEFPSNVQKSTGGHLIVLVGFDENGDALVNDPASRERGHLVTYKKTELERAWLGAGGVTYVISRRTPTTRP